MKQGFIGCGIVFSATLLTNPMANLFFLLYGLIIKETESPFLVLLRKSFLFDLNFIKKQEHCMTLLYLKTVAVLFAGDYESCAQ